MSLIGIENYTGSRAETARHVGTGQYNIAGVDGAYSLFDAETKYLFAFRFCRKRSDLLSGSRGSGPQEQNNIQINLANKKGDFQSKNCKKKGETSLGLIFTKHIKCV